MTRVAGDWLHGAACQEVMALFTDAGHQIFAVGGCVRNDLLGAPVADVDLSTSALPAQSVALAQSAGLKAIPTGIDHGTVTILAQGVPFEVTTFRADIETDGRHAVVRYSQDLAEDAVRRDFTMNALYADATGDVTDPLGGLPDLQARRLRFIQDPHQRIREDYLRILRFFRFFAWYGDPDQGMDNEALAGIADNLDGLNGLSRERVGAEMLKLLNAPDPVMAVSVMGQCGVLPMIFPGSSAKALGPLTLMEEALALPPNPIRRLACLGDVEPASLRLSNAQAKTLVLYRDEIGSTADVQALAYRHGAAVALDIIALRAAVLEMPLPPDASVQAVHAAAQVFPIKAQDLMPRFQGPALGEALRKLEADWIASGFTMQKNRLLSSLGDDRAK